MRTSRDQWRLPNGKLILTAPGDKPSKDAVLVNGYDYDKQEWVREGKPV